MLACLFAVTLGCGAPPPAPASQPGSPTTEPARRDPETELEERTRDVIVANRPRLRACYEDALAKSPDLEGRVLLVVDVGQNGKAAHVLEAHREGLDDAVVRCLAHVLRTIAFHDGAASTIRIQVPLAFSKQN
jgi:hypothetical protein